MSRNHVWRLEFILATLKSNVTVTKEVAEENRRNPDRHAQGIATGLEIASKNIEPVIEKLDELLLEMSGYMEEDVDLSGGEELEEQAV